MQRPKKRTKRDENAFKLLYAVIVLNHHRRRVVHFEVTENATQVWLARQITEAFPWESLRRDFNERANLDRQSFQSKQFSRVSDLIEV